MNNKTNTKETRSRKLTEEKLLKARQMHKDGYGYRLISLHLNVSPVALKRALCEVDGVPSNG
jgi:hypothetical protein